MNTTMTAGQPRVPMPAVWPLTVGLGGFCVLFAVATWIYLPAFSILPFEGDNFYVLSWAHTAKGAALLLVDPDIYPEWRPLAYLSVWMQYHGLGSMGPFILVNLVVLTACAWLVFRIVLDERGSLLIALAAAAWALTDARSAMAVAWIVERQSSMACLFGMLALLADDYGIGRPEAARRWGLVAGALVLASLLSKEYGVAFAAALTARALWERRFWSAAMAGVATMTYLALRLLVVHGAVSAYCPEAGFFFGHRVVCFDGAVSSTVVSQMVYNIVATAIGSVVPGVFTGDGAIGLSRMRLLLGALGFMLAVIGWKQGSPLVRWMLAVIVVNAGLSLLLYRDRNQLIALYAMAPAVGVGAADVMQRASTLIHSRTMRAAGICLVLAGVSAVQAYRTHSVVDDARALSWSTEPCRDDYVIERTERFFDVLARRYGIHVKDCARS